MLKRNLIAAAVAGLAIVSNAALANEWAFDDAYWKAPQASQFVKQDNVQVAAANKSAKEQRDEILNGYNP